MKLILYSIICLLLAGCTSEQLKQSTIAQGQTLTDLEYKMVLDNIAMFRHTPHALPWNLKIVQGNITINDTISPAYNYSWGKTLSRMPGVSAKRGWQVAWTVVPDIDAKDLTNLGKVYSVNSGDTWINDGLGPFGSFSGQYDSYSVWVDPTNIELLTDLTTNVLGTAPTTAADRGLVLAH